MMVRISLPQLSASQLAHVVSVQRDTFSGKLSTTACCSLPGVSTHGALADATSKGLVRTIFEKLRKKLMDWQAIAWPSCTPTHPHTLIERFAHMKRFGHMLLKWSIKK
jgi:hypothetical protein